MESYVALLRGINVSGANIILMNDLRKSFENLKFSNVKSYLQSGNMVFNSKIDEKEKLQALIHSCILNDFGHTVKVIVISKDKFKAVFTANPFAQNKSLDNKKMCTVFFGGEPDFEAFNKIKANPNITEELVLGKNVIYMYYPNGIGKAKVSNNFLEKKLKVSATTRNWRTVTNINALLS